MKNVLITGVSGGMGKATALQFIQNGYNVYGLDINDIEEIDHLYFYKVDLTKEESILEVFNKINDLGIRFDLIIHQSGIYDLNSLIEISEKDFIRIFDINLFAVYRINKIFLPLLNKGGKIIITTSELAPLEPLPFTGIYGISKTALEKYAYSLRMELQLLGYQVVVVRPGVVETKLLDVSTSKLDKFGETTTHYNYNAKKFKDIVNKVETKKISPNKIAELVFKISKKKNPKYIYNINRNKGLLLLNSLPKRSQNHIIKKLISK